MDTFNFVVEALFVLTVTLALALAGPLLSIALRERRNPKPLDSRAVIGAGIVGSWVFPGVLVIALYVAEAFGFEPVGSGEPLAPPIIRILWTAVILTGLGVAVGAGVLILRRVQRRRLAH